MMRTTVRIAEDLLRELKQQAYKEGTSLTKVLNRVLHAGLDAIHTSTRKEEPFRQQTTDIYLAAMAIGRDATLASCGTDFARFRQLRWENPLDG